MSFLKFVPALEHDCRQRRSRRRQHVYEERLCPKLCPGGVWTRLFSLYAMSCKSSEIQGNPTRAKPRQVLDSSCDQYLGAGGHGFKPIAPTKVLVSYCVTLVRPCGRSQCTMAPLLPSPTSDKIPRLVPHLIQHPGLDQSSLRLFLRRRAPP